MKNVLITGGAGFIGSNFVRQLLKKEPDVNIVNLDALTYAGNLSSLSDILDSHVFVKGNICNGELLDHLFNKYCFDTVINFAAESHVDRSILDPSVFINTNVLGTQTLLDVSKKHWKVSSDLYNCDYESGVKFIQISTDETYGDIDGNYKFTEQTPLSPNSPYSASKAGADCLVKAYHRTYGMPVCITRCSNNYGPYQFPEKLIPLVIKNALESKPIPVYGDGLQIRDWIYVEDHCSAVYDVATRGRVGEVYNVGSNNEITNIEIVRTILNELDRPESLIKHSRDRLGHDRHYAIDSSKISVELSWSPKYSFKDGIKKTIEWYLDNTGWLNEVTSGQYMQYYDTMYRNA